MGELFDVGAEGDIAPGEAKLVEAEGREIALFNCDGEYFALDNDCTHIGGPLCEGEISGDRVICPWHGSEFSIKTGEVLGPPADENVNTYKVRVEGGRILIEI
ncbi:MAG: non-heme iron oxygenase ferredoxin subunit [Thermodesulfobacteriota bacterium]